VDRRARLEPAPRSLLFVPGDRAVELFPKALRSGADAVILDLEDAVAAEAKEAARDAVRACLAEDRAARDGGEHATTLRCVRLSPVDGRVPDADIALVAETRPDVVMLPKADGPEDVVRLASALEERSATTPIIAIVETARGVMNVDAIARATGLRGLAFGAEDLAADLGLPPGDRSIALLAHRSRVVVAARAHGCASFDGVTIEIPAAARTAHDARRARRLGFDGKLCVHPSQVGPIHAAFRPTAQEVEEARQIVDAYEQALARGEGVTRAAGRMIDAPVAASARRTLALAGR
jgi:citrate lyase subunit beta/citryl-CoA lyase